MTARKLVSHALVAVLVASSAASAAPRGREARAHFDAGVAAYTKGDYEAASISLGKSFAVEADAETLFAWAQTERKLGRCDKAIELYTDLLTMKLTAENKQAIEDQITECKAIIAQKPAEPVVAPKPEPPPPAPEQRAWWKDPIGGALVGVGAVGLGVGAVFLVQARAADRDKDAAATYDEFIALDDRAQSRGRLGVIASVAGGALVAGGIVWYVTRSRRDDRAITGWLAPSGGGLAVTGSF